MTRQTTGFDIDTVTFQTGGSGFLETGGTAFTVLEVTGGPPRSVTFRAYLGNVPTPETTLEVGREYVLSFDRLEFSSLYGAGVYRLQVQTWQLRAYGHVPQPCPGLYWRPLFVTPTRVTGLNPTTQSQALLGIDAGTYNLDTLNELNQPWRDADVATREGYVADSFFDGWIAIQNNNGGTPAAMLKDVALVLYCLPVIPAGAVDLTWLAIDKWNIEEWPASSVLSGDTSQDIAGPPSITYEDGGAGSAGGSERWAIARLRGDSSRTDGSPASGIEGPARPVPRCPYKLMLQFGAGETATDVDLLACVGTVSR